VIAHATGPVSVPMHAPTSGTITAIEIGRAHV
jgi:Na+-translocating ferredoxin:NAD+ oxidoreductase RnfC subunit